MMNENLDPLLLEVLTDSTKILDVIVTGRDSSAVKELTKVEELQVTRVIQFINAVAGRIRAKDVVLLSRSPIVRSIELDQIASVEPIISE